MKSIGKQVDTMQYLSPLRYPGGKSKLSDFMKLIIEKNSLSDGIYVEPYAGGAGIAFDLLFNEYVKKIIINDLDYSIYSFWFSVLNHPEELCALIQNKDVNINNWKKQKEVQRKKYDFSILDVGFSTFFLNRTNRSGIIRGGAIGGTNQKGKWKIDARYNKEELISRILRISKYKNRIDLFNLDACAFIPMVGRKLPNKTLFYIDPPYYIKGKELYEHHYNYEDHLIVSEIIKGIDLQNWIITYDYVPEICEIYHGFRQKKYPITYTAAIKQSGTEIMIFDNNLVLPRVKNPISVNN